MTGSMGGIQVAIQRVQTHILSNQTQSRFHRLKIILHNPGLGDERSLHQTVTVQIICNMPVISYQ